MAKSSLIGEVLLPTGASVQATLKELSGPKKSPETLEPSNNWGSSGASRTISPRKILLHAQGPASAPWSSLAQLWMRDCHKNIRILTHSLVEKKKGMFFL